MATIRDVRRASMPVIAVLALLIIWVRGLHFFSGGSLAAGA